MWEIHELSFAKLLMTKSRHKQLVETRNHVRQTKLQELCSVVGGLIVSETKINSRLVLCEFG